MTTTNKPVNEVKVGRVRAAIWSNETKNGTRYGITIGRLYKTEEGSWKTSSTLDPEDLIAASRALDLADFWVREVGKPKAEAEPAEEAV